MKNVIVAIIVLFFTVGCSSQKTTATKNANTTTNEQRPNRGQRGERPSVDEIFKMEDANNDGKLSQAEVKGPLQREFSKIDSNGDGFITREELANAPKPQGRPGQRNQK